MVEIGYMRWFVGAWEKPLGNGNCLWSLSLVPEAKIYRIAATGGGILADKFQDVYTRPFEVRRTEPMYMTADTKVRIVKQMAQELTWETLQWCGMQGLVGGSLQDYAKVVFWGLIDVCQNARPDNDPQVPFIDLIVVEHQVETMNLLQRQQREAITRESRDRYERQQAAEMDHQDEERRQRSSDAARTEAEYTRQREYRNAADTESLKLMLSWLSETERDEAVNSGYVTVNNDKGRFVVPVGHGKVKRFVNDQEEAQYCMIFRDYTIPVGDEVLMKVALLKTDPERFLREANRFGA